MPIFLQHTVHPIKDIIPKGTSLQGFADDHFMYKIFRPALSEERIVTDLEEIMCKVMDWMSSMRLKLNTDKTEFIKFGNSSQLKKTKINSFRSGNDVVQCCTSVKCLGATLDNQLNMKEHVKNTGENSYV